MKLLIKYILSSILLGTIPSILGDDTPMIVGGWQASPGEYPYYVLIGGCGGTLIASDMVLTAAHCTSVEEGTTAYVGAYRRDNSDGLAEVRWCESHVVHPQYSSESYLDNDVALCKLNKPVFIDQTSVILELNERNSSPSDGEALKVVGLGKLQIDDNSANILQEVTLPAISNDICTDRYGDDTGYPEVTENMLCAGYYYGQRGACYGDSGGPLVQISEGVHTLVGVVSWSGKENLHGDYGCAIEDRPDVFTRVSKVADWIKQTACNMESSADFCGQYPVKSSCGAGKGGLRYKASLWTDTWSSETTISSYSFNQDYTALDKLIFRQAFPSLGVSSMQHFFPSYDKYYCLENNRCYYFQITDAYGDGISHNTDYGPIFEGILGNKVTFEGSPAFEYVANKIFCTGKVCKDKQGFKIGKNKMNCKKYITGTLNAMRKKCRKRYRGGDPVHKSCPQTCGRKAGVGDCHWWKDMEAGLKQAEEDRLRSESTQNPTYINTL